MGQSRHCPTNYWRRGLIVSAIRAVLICYKKHGYILTLTNIKKLLVLGLGLLRPKSKSLSLVLIPQVIGLGLGLGFVASVLGLGLEFQVLVNITAYDMCRPQLLA